MSQSAKFLLIKHSTIASRWLKNRVTFWLYNRFDALCACVFVRATRMYSFSNPKQREKFFAHSLFFFSSKYHSSADHQMSAPSSLSSSIMISVLFCWSCARANHQCKHNLLWLCDINCACARICFVNSLSLARSHFHLLSRLSRSKQTITHWRSQWICFCSTKSVHFIIVRFGERKKTDSILIVIQIVFFFSFPLRCVICVFFSLFGLNHKNFHSITKFRISLNTDIAAAFSKCDSSKKVVDGWAEELSQRFDSITRD